MFGASIITVILLVFFYALILISKLKYDEFSLQNSMLLHVVRCSVKHGAVNVNQFGFTLIEIVRMLAALVYYNPNMIMTQLIV